jgi:hypothetical protein
VRDLIELLGLLQLVWHLLLVAFGLCLVTFGVLIVACAWVALRDRLDRRREAIRALDDARRERQLLDDLLGPAPDGTVPPESLAVGRARLAAELQTPTVDALYERLPDLPDWPQENQ